MFPFKMRYFLFNSVFILFLGCAPSLYKDRQPKPGDSACLLKLKPEFKVNWYNASIDVMGHHITGLLLFKSMPDSSLRIVFTNEVGVTFFDFKFRADGQFSVQQVFSRFDNKPVINLLRSDFELMIMRHATAGLAGYTWNDEVFYTHTGKKETDYFITDKDCASLLRIEKASKRKEKVEVRLLGEPQKAPDSVHLKHFTFNMEIALKKLQR